MTYAEGSQKQGHPGIDRACGVNKWKQWIIGGSTALGALLIASSGRAASVGLGWDPVPSVAGYRLYYGATSRQYTNFVEGPLTTNTVSGLALGVTYYFAVTAYNDLGIESGFSSEVSYQPAIVASNKPPTLNTIANVSLGEDSGPQTVALTGITAGASNETQTLTVTATSSNPSLIPSLAVNYVSPNASGTLSFTPSPNMNGSSVITVTVDDGQSQNNKTSRSFTVTVQAVNDVPSISSIADLTIDQGSSTGPIPFSVADLETPASNLVVSAVASNSVLVPPSAIVLSGTDSARAVTVTPAPDQAGTSEITLSVSDGAASASSSFTLIVSASGGASNSPPTVSSIEDQIVARNQSTADVPFTIGDLETPANQLTLSASWSNPAVISRVTFGGTASDRTVKVTPTRGKTGSSSITVKVSDGEKTASITFQFRVG